MPDPTKRTAGWRESTLGVTMCGASGAGKTTTARALHYTFDGPSILIDLDHEPDMGKVVQSVEGLRDALAAGHTEIAVRPADTVVEEPDLFEDVVRYLLRFGNELREQGTGKMQLLMDEAQDLHEKWTTVALKRFRKRRIKPVAMTQDPISMSKRLRTVAEFNCWLSPPPDDMEASLESVGYPVELLNRLDQYEMLVLGEGWKPVDRIKAAERFAVE